MRRSGSSRCGLAASRLPAMSPHVEPSDAQLDAASWCRHLVPDGSVYAFLADHRHELFPPELFADLVVQGRSHPSVPTQVVATVMVLQALEGLSDREAISALRRDIVWKVACGLRLTTRASIPRCWCTGATASAPRPGHSGSCRRSARWWSKAGGFRAAPAGAGLHRLGGRGRHQDTVTQLIAAIRRVRRLVAAARETGTRSSSWMAPEPSTLSRLWSGRG